MTHRKSPTGHNLFTEVTWKDEHEHWQTGMSPEATRRDPRLDYWMAQHDMEVYLSEGSDIPLEWARVLVPAALNGLPVTITTRQNDMTVTETGIVTQVHGPESSHFYFKKWGGSHPVYYSTVVTIHVPEHIAVLHTAEGNKVLSDIHEHVSRDGSPVDTERYAAVSRVGTGPVPPVK